MGGYSRASTSGLRLDVSPLLVLGRPGIVELVSQGQKLMYRILHRCGAVSENSLQGFACVCVCVFFLGILFASGRHENSRQGFIGLIGL